jgi:hypothetical protein
MFATDLDSYQIDDLSILLNKDVEILGRYFDVVPDGNIFTQNAMPIFSVRLKAEGINIIADYYSKKYAIDIKTAIYNFNSENFTMYPNDASSVYQHETIKKHFDFHSLKINGARGLIITLVNKDARLMHAIPIIYGFNEFGKKFVVIMDPYFEYEDGSIEAHTSSLIAAKFFYQNFNNIDIYCHNEKLIADHHSCAIVACDLLKNCLVKDAKILKTMLSNKIKTISIHSNCIFNINKFELNSEILKFSQLSNSYKSMSSSENVSRSRISFFDYINRNKILVNYYKEPEPYDPSKMLLPSDLNGFVKKEINAKLLKKGHQYAKLIMKLTGYKGTLYNPDYWLRVIDSQKVTGESKIIKFIKNAICPT